MWTIHIDISVVFVVSFGQPNYMDSIEDKKIRNEEFPFTQPPKNISDVLHEPTKWKIKKKLKSN